MVTNASFSRILAGLGAAVFLLAVSVVGAVHYINSIAQLQRSAEKSNAALTRALGNALRVELAEFLEGNREPLPPTRIATMRRQIATAVQGTEVLTVKLYNLAGVTVFSTDPRQIGEDQSGNRGFAGARAGRVMSAVTFRDQLDGFDGSIADRDLVESYVPVRAAGGAIKGVFQVYADVTEFKTTIWHTLAIELGTLAVGFTIVFALLFAIVQRNARLVRRQHSDNLRLANSAARAEAASRAKTEFLMYVSQELRPALNAIIGSSAPATGERGGLAPAAATRDRIDAIHALGTQLLQIINDSVDLVRLEAGRMAATSETVPLVPLVDALVRDLAPRAGQGGIALRLELDGDLPTIRSDAHRLRQALLNVLDNALKFTPAGGTVVVRLRRCGDGIEVAIEDTGIGIAAADLARHLAPLGEADFELLRRTRSGGVGLRLSRGLVELIGGQFDIESVPGKGTTARITVPAPAR
jgi:two-component system, cell cycle sensor histidine kinase PleC